MTPLDVLLVPCGHLNKKQHSVRGEMRPKAFVVPFKETTIGGRSRAISLRGDQPSQLHRGKYDTADFTADSTDFREADMHILQEVINKHRPRWPRAGVAD